MKSIDEILPGDPLYSIIQNAAVKAVQGHARRQQPCRAQMDRRLLFAGPGVVLAAILIGIAIGWWMHSPATELACGDQADGSRMCWMWVRLPKN
jgi:hypothetical protein